jgi:hypothetical protein
MYDRTFSFKTGSMHPLTIERVTERSSMPDLKRNTGFLLERLFWKETADLSLNACD